MTLLSSEVESKEKRLEVLTAKDFEKLWVEGGVIEREEEEEEVIEEEEGAVVDDSLAAAI